MGPGGPRERDSGSEGNDVDDRVQVLLVEDDEDFADMYRLKLEADGYEDVTPTEVSNRIRRWSGTGQTPKSLGFRE